MAKDAVSMLPEAQTKKTYPAEMRRFLNSSVLELQLHKKAEQNQPKKEVSLRRDDLVQKRCFNLGRILGKRNTCCDPNRESKSSALLD